MKKNIVNQYYNLIVLVLLVAILLTTGNLILNREVLADSQGVYEKNQFFLRSIQQVFPAPIEELEISVKRQVERFYSSFFNGLFQVDFKDPLTFVQAQIPVVALHRETVMAGSIPVEKIDPKEVETKPEEGSLGGDLYFADYYEEDDVIQEDHLQETSAQPEMDEDDKGERQEGVYLIDQHNIIDSLAGDLEGALAGLTRPEKIKFQAGKPDILIYHVHGTESYKPISEGNYHSLQREYTVIKVAEIMTEELEKRGYHVIHDTTYHDYPSYSGSYTRGLATARGILKENPSIQVVLDIHRDGYDHIETNPNRQQLIANNQTTINNETTTKFQFVIGPAAENRQRVERFAHFVNAVSDQKYPGLAKPVLVKPYGQFNQFLVDHYALLEVGSNANHIDEAKRTAVYLAEVMADTLDLLKE
ncbi:Stage II sporulation P family protein [Alkaliphilus metalliredigens QYMF]|uniref:Stage II sporulation P family protein n=1 Tax=Alkaliphilus metalliredigens (strain QYMF) TaxID=293826 RepID=A6TSM6_ALKMQ|nr:stage II sporulation protein P [Alkaliphilus metalliredigens]ABR49194.1 Stage II sporulation P family protein [Alkaliphilus metalliredigens QYMF]